MPGQTIPTHRRPPPPPVSPDSDPFQSQQPSVIDMLQLFQSSVDKQLNTVCDKLETINSRMTVLETRQKSLEDEVRSSTSSSTNSTPQSGRRRKRLTPVALQVYFLPHSAT